MRVRIFVLGSLEIALFGLVMSGGILRSSEIALFGGAEETNVNSRVEPGAVNVTGFTTPLGGGCNVGAT